MNKPLFDIDRPSLQAEVNSYVPGNGLAWRDLFPLKYTPKFDLHGIEGDEGIPVSADRVAFNTKAPLKTRKTIGKWDGHLAKIATSRSKNEIEINEYRDLQSIAASSDTDSDAKRYLVDMVYDDVKFCADGMDYRIELDAMRIASHGIQDFPASIEGENATQDIINFNIPTENFGGAATAWTDEDNADGIADIVKMQKSIIKKGLRRPQYVFMELAAFELLTAQKKTLNRLSAWNAYTGSSAILTADSVDLNSVNSYMSRKGYPQIVILDTYVTVEAKDGSKSTIKPFAENVVLLAPEMQLGWTYYKTVPSVENTDALQVNGAYYKITRYSEQNPMSETTMAEAYVQCGLINRSSLCFINTAKTTWNGGNA